MVVDAAFAEQDPVAVATPEQSNLAGGKREAEPLGGSVARYQQPFEGRAKVAELRPQPKQAGNAHRRLV